MTEGPPSSSVSPPTPPRYEGVFEAVRGNPEQQHFLFKVAPNLILNISAKSFAELTPADSEKWLALNIINLSRQKGSSGEEPTNQTILIDVESLAAQLQMDPEILKKELSDAKKVGDVAVQTLLTKKAQAHSQVVAQKLNAYVQANKDLWQQQVTDSKQEYQRFKVDLKLPQSFHAVVTKAGLIFIKAKNSPVFARGASSAIKEVELYPKQAEVLAVREVAQEQEGAVKKQLEILSRVQGLEGVYDFHFAYVYKGKEVRKLGILSKFEKFGSLRDQLLRFEVEGRDYSEGFGTLGKTKYSDPRYQVIRAVLVGIMNIHQKGVLHRDLKAENILLGEQDGFLAAKVADFDLACDLKNTDELQQPRGTPAFFSPEVCKAMRGDDVSGIVFGTPIDMWGLGLVCYELVYGGFFPIYVELMSELEAAIRKDSEVNMKPYLDKVIQAMEDPEVFPQPTAENHPMEMLLWKALRPNPAERITFAEFLQEFDAMFK